MANFYYKAKDNNNQDIKGLVEAEGNIQAQRILRERGFFPYSIKEKRENLIQDIYKKLFKGVSLSDLAGFTRQLSTMINAGLPLTESLTILKNQEESSMAPVASSALRDIEGGMALAESFGKFPKVFSSVYLALIRAGESAGVLDKILSRLADNLESQREFKAKVKGAMMYPVIIIIGMALVMMLMMIFVIPKLTSLYTEFDASLPKPTEILIAISNFFVKFWWLVIFLFFGGVYLFKIINSTKSGRRKIDEWKFKIPIFGKLQKQIIFAEFTRTLGLLISSGVSIMEALEISSKTADNIVVEEAIIEVNKQVEKGFPLANSISQDPVFPVVLSQMLTVGEETGKVDEVLMKVSHFFQSESEESLKGLTTAIEPLIMLLLGVGVGFLIIAIILPIYNLTSQIK